MGNAICPCFQQKSMRASVKLIFWEGETRILNGGKHTAGDIMSEPPDKMVCHADSFFIGHPLPALAIDDELMPGQTYFVLPIDRFACNVLSASSLAAFSSSSSSSTASSKLVTPVINFDLHCRPFEYVKGENDRVLIKVMPEFIVRLIQRGKELDHHENGSSSSLLCSTPELKKQYDLLVGSRDQVWSPKLEPISEYKIRFSHCRFIGLEWKQQEKAF